MSQFSNLPELPNLSLPMGGASQEDKEGMSTLFHVEIPDFWDMIFKSCEGIESEVEVNTLFDGGSLNPPHTVRGLHRVNKISFGKGTVGKKASERPLSEWYEEVCDPNKPLVKRKLSITVTDKHSKPLAGWIIKNA